MVSVRRVVPWKRDLDVPPDEFQILLDVFTERHPTRSTDLIEKAYKRSFEAHSGQIRKSGEPYFLHPLAVARIVAEQGMDEVSIAAALLHDAVEDTELALEEIEADFGADVAYVVDGCTKVDRLQFDSKEAQQAETLRKMMVAVARDVRVLIIKLADRLHNMRTLAVLPVWKQHRTANETMAVYAPLAHRLGMTSLKSQLEDLSFAAMHPKWFAEIDFLVAQRDPERDVLLTQVSSLVKEELNDAGIKAYVTGRPKHLYSIYQKMVLKRKAFDEIYDLVGIRIIAEDVAGCYGALGAVHNAWTPVSGRFKDFIAMPKFNLYQSLHTTVVGPSGIKLDVQIRTRDMHARAEFGVASHWIYKGNGETAETELAWLQRISEFTAEDGDAAAFLTNLQLDLGKDEVLVFSPKGRIVTLEAEATPVDFAYAIHTEIGHNCIGAVVNDEPVALDVKLVAGDTVKIVTSSSAAEATGPSEEWLRFVVTHKAENAIRRWHAREERADVVSTGRDMLEKVLRAEGFPSEQVLDSSTLDRVATDMGYSDREVLLSAVGEEHVTARAVVSRVSRALKGVEDREESTDESSAASESAPSDEGERVSRSLFSSSPRVTTRDRRRSVGVHVEGFENEWVRLSKCCRPVPPDQIIGFHTRGRGVSVHRTDCTNAVSLQSQQQDKLIDAEWDAAYMSSFVASIEVRAFDRSHLLADVASCMSEQEVNIVAAQIRMGADHVTSMQIDFELGDVAQLDSVLREVRKVDGVYSAARVADA